MYSHIAPARGVAMTALRRAALAALLLPATGFGQYSIEWQAIGGGGGVSTAAATQLAGTIGQPSPGYSDGGDYRLTAGFWVAAPLLSDRIFSDAFQGETP